MLTFNDQTYSVKTWAIKLQVPVYCLAQFEKKYDQEKCNTILKNIIDNHLFDLEHKKITVNNISMTLFDWSKQLYLSKYHLFFHAYEYGIVYVQQYIENILNNNIDFKNLGNIIVVNNIRNNCKNWSILAGKNIGYMSLLISSVGEQQAINTLAKILAIPSSTSEEILEINNIKRTYNEWAVFCNKPIHYIHDIINKYGITYAKQFICNLLNTDKFLNKSMLLTINNHTYSLYKWAQIINVIPAILYNIRSLRGLDAVIRYIKDKLQNINNTNITVDNISKSLSEWSFFFNEEEHYFNNILEKYDIPTVKQVIKYKILADKCQPKQQEQEKELIITVNNISKTVSEWNKFFKLKNNTIQNYINNSGYNDTINYISSLLTKRKNIIFVNNISKTLSEWAIYLGYSAGYFYTYLRTYGRNLTERRITRLYNVFSDIPNVDYFSLSQEEKKKWQKILTNKIL